VLEIHLPRLHQMRVHALTLRARPLLPGGDGALIEAKGGYDGLRRTAMRKQREHGRHHRRGRAQSKERCAGRRTKGAATGVAAIPAFLEAMETDVALPTDAPVRALLVRAELTLRVHGACAPGRGEEPRLCRACPLDPLSVIAPPPSRLNGVAPIVLTKRGYNL